MKFRIQRYADNLGLERWTAYHVIEFDDPGMGIPKAEPTATQLAVEDGRVVRAPWECQGQWIGPCDAIAADQTEIERNERWGHFASRERAQEVCKRYRDQFIVPQGDPEEFEL